MTPIPRFFLRYSKDIANLLFWELWKCLIIPPSKSYDQIIASSPVNSFLSYCREIANMLF